MGLIDSLKSLTDSLEVMYEKDLANLRSFEGIERLDELIDLLLSLEKNDTFKKISLFELIGEGDAFDYDIKKIPMHYGANI